MSVPIEEHPEYRKAWLIWGQELEIADSIRSEACAAVKIGGVSLDEYNRKIQSIFDECFLRRKQSTLKFLDVYDKLSLKGGLS